MAVPAVPAVRFSLTSDLCILTSFPEPRTLNPPSLSHRTLLRPRLPSRPLPQTPSPCPPSAGRGAEAFVWILPGSHAKITAGFFDDAAFPLPPPAFRLARLPPLRCLTLAPATPSRLQQGPSIKRPPRARRPQDVVQRISFVIGAGLLHYPVATLAERRGCSVRVQDMGDTKGSRHR